MAEKRRQISFQALPEVKPFFSDAASVRTLMNEYGKKKDRDARLDILFINRDIVVSNVQLSPEHANTLVKILVQELKKIAEFKKTGKKPKVSATPVERTDYIG